METVNEISLSISEFQDVNKVNEELTPLSFDEQDAIAGGNWFSDFVTQDIPYGYRKFEGGVKRAGQGLKDSAAQSPSRYDDLWYNLGYSASSLIPD
jgi:hypothetical protein